MSKRRGSCDAGVYWVPAFAGTTAGNCDPASGTSTIVALRNVSKTFPRDTTALAGLTLDVDEGEFVSLLGPSGCGKSTALRIVAGLSPASAGTVTGRRKYVAAKIGFVFQEPTLTPWADVAANVRLPLRLAHAHAGAVARGG